MRKAIPEDIKRRVRQHCGFGCVICGSPIYDYDHIEEFATVKEHSFDNLVLLCPTCHRKKTNGLISKKKVLNARDQVISRTRTNKDQIQPQFYHFHVGGNIIELFSGQVFSIYGFGQLDIVFKDIPLINAVIFDQNGKEAIRINENNYTLCTTTWDIEYVGKTLTFRNGPRQIFASITLDVENKLITLTANIELKNEVKIKINEQGIFAGDKLLATKNLIYQTGSAITITDYPINPSAAVSGAGSVHGSHFIEILGAAIINSIDCMNNQFGKCQNAFVWTEDYLKSLMVTTSRSRYWAKNPFLPWNSSPSIQRNSSSSPSVQRKSTLKPVKPYIFR